MPGKFTTSLQRRLADDVRRGLEDNDMTQADLARATGFGASHVSLLLSGERGGTLKAWDTMLKAATGGHYTRPERTPKPKPAVAEMLSQPEPAMIPQGAGRGAAIAARLNAASRVVDPVKPPKPPRNAADEPLLRIGGSAYPIMSTNGAIIGDANHVSDPEAKLVGPPVEMSSGGLVDDSPWRDEYSIDEPDEPSPQPPPPPAPAAASPQPVADIVEPPAAPPARTPRRGGLNPSRGAPNPSRNPRRPRIEQM